MISLRLAGRFGGEAQEIVLRTGEAQESGGDGAVAGPSQFRIPNVVAPSDGDPIPPFPLANKSSPPSTFPFTSMTQAASATIHNRTENLFPVPPPPPPPYPDSSSPNVALSSPLLVNLLQNEGIQGPSTSKMPPPVIPPVANKQLPRPVVSSSVTAKKPSPPPDVLQHQVGTSAFVSVNPPCQRLSELPTQLVQKAAPTVQPAYQRPVPAGTPQPTPQSVFNTTQVCIQLYFKLLFFSFLLGLLILFSVLSGTNTHASLV